MSIWGHKIDLFFGKINKKMKAKYFLLSMVAAFIVSDVLTTVWYMVMDEANYVSFRREEMNYGLLTLNHLIYAAIMVYFYTFYFAKKPKLSDSFIYGALMAAMMFIPSALVVRSIWTVDVNPIFFLNTLAHLLIGGVMAVVIHLIVRKHI